MNKYSKTEKAILIFTVVVTIVWTLLLGVAVFALAKHFLGF